MSAELARFQELLIEVLREETDPERALDRLRAHPDAAAHRDWLDRVEPRMLRVAAGLVRRWEVREG
ncbi:MAG: hypothetical protein H6738_20645 [Alphaproteobacteria bacterium]|nr:hypothetical protein [Alphaproteobacteria bacterium]MCB9699201.1 hypothetical protein [Alphaproteobacteria bacterium]